MKTRFNQFLLEKLMENLIVYRGEAEGLTPIDNDYNFFSEDLSFAEDYGDAVWKCEFNPLNLFVSYDKNSIIELYDKGYKLSDEYLEDNWEYEKNDDIKNSYDYNVSNTENGFKTASCYISYPSRSSDTWETYEKSHGVMDYILSKYDGVVLLEGGQVTYYIRTDKIVNSEIVD